jgi:hypothetical protein
MLGAVDVGPVGAGRHVHRDVAGRVVPVVGGWQGGEFTSSYPMAVPPVPGGLLPDVAVGYSSGSVDGRTVATNNQTSWVGEGWGLEFPYVERAYRSCKSDGQTIDDFCWFDGDNVSVMFGGRSSRLVHDDATDTFVAEADGRLWA